MCDNNNQCHSNYDIITSIALEEAAIAHILNAEGEKIQLAVALNSSIDDLLKVNCSVSKTIKDVTMLEIALYNKLEIACNYSPPAPRHQGNICVKVLCENTNLPIANVLIEIYCNDCKIQCGYTDCCGKFLSKLVDFGVYKVKVVYDNLYIEKNIEVKNCHCNDVLFYFPCKVKPTPKPSICSIGTICGKVLTPCGKAVSGAVITVFTCNKKYVVISSECGNYIIKNALIGGQIYISASCGCNESKRHIVHNYSKNIVKIDLIMPIK